MQATRRALMLGSAAAAGLSACASPTPPVTARPSAPSDALGDLDATGVAARIRAGEITAREAVEAAAARAERLEPQINAIVTPTYAQARLAASAPVRGPFAGAPTLIKDLSPQRGVTCAFGSRAYAEYIPEQSSAHVLALEAAGLISIGKSATPEFGLDATTEPLLSGPTRNPWDLARSAGGSSGGAAAAVAAGVVPIAHASDGGGSIRIPAACCGLFGFKPSRGRTAKEPSAAPVDLSVEGCVSRSVRDSAAWIAATAVTDQGLGPMPLITGPSERRLTVAIALNDLLGRPPQPEVAAAVQAAADLLQTLGHRVAVAPALGGGEAFAQAFQLYWASGAAQAVEEVRQARPGEPLDALLEPFTLALAEEAARAAPGAIDQAIATLQQFEVAYAQLFTQMDVLLTPVLASPPVPIGTLAPTRPYPELQEALLDYVAYTPLQNVAGAPAMSMPLGTSRGGLPIGVQFASYFGEDAALFALAYELEQAAPWADRRPIVHA